PALSQLAPVLRAGEEQVLAQHLEQRLVRRERDLDLLAVEAQRQRHVPLRKDPRLAHAPTLARARRGSRLDAGRAARPRTRNPATSSATDAAERFPSGRNQRAVQFDAPRIALVTTSSSHGARSFRRTPAAIISRIPRSYRSRLATRW